MRQESHHPRLAGWLLLLAMLSVALTPIAVLFAVVTTDPPLSVHAPDTNYVARGNFLIGRPDFTGCPRWTLQRLTDADLEGPGDRNRSAWHVDADALPERHATNADYARSGYAKGHLVPAANCKGSQADTDESHTLANAVPQKQQFNAQSWARVEERARTLKRAGAQVVIFTAPVWQPQTRKFEKNVTSATIIITTIGRSEIWVPTHLVKSLLVTDATGTRVETYFAANVDAVAGYRIEQFQHVSVDDVERMLSMDLWRGLDDTLEKKLEKERPE